MAELIDFLLITILVIYVVRSIIRIGMRVLFQSVVNKGPGQQQNYQQHSNKATGAVKVDFIPKGKKNTVPDSEGEFIDYEEIK